MKRILVAAGVLGCMWTSTLASAQSEWCPGVDLEIKKFKVTSRVKLDKDKPIRIELTVENKSEAQGPCQAFVLGTQNGIRVYEVVYTASDPAGGGATPVEIWPFVPADSGYPVEAGPIHWECHVIDDDNHTQDYATAVTEVLE